MKGRLFEKKQCTFGVTQRNVKDHYNSLLQFYYTCHINQGNFGSYSCFRRSSIALLFNMNSEDTVRPAKQDMIITYPTL